MSEQGGSNRPGGQQPGPEQPPGSGPNPPTGGQSPQQAWQPGQQPWQPPQAAQQAPQAGQPDWQQPTATTGPQYGQPPSGPPNWQQPNQGAGQQGWQAPQSGQHGQPTGAQGWQPPQPGQQGQPTGQQGWQQPGQPTGPQNWQQPGQQGQPGGQQAWQQPGQPTGPWQGQPANTQGFPQGPGQQGSTPYGPGGPNDQWAGQQGGTPPTKSRKPVIITAIAVVVALVAAVGVYFLAIRDTNTTTAAEGQGTPQQAVESLFSSLGDSDPIGVADQLDPAESALFTDLNTDVISELKRLDVLSDAASADSMTGTTISVADVTYDAAAEETITDNLHIVKLTGGTITVKSDPAQIPLSDNIKNAFSSEIDEAQPQSETVNIADAVKENDGEPIRIATVKRGDEWYVSLFYSIADNATHEAGLPNPTKADQIPAEGKDSPEDAVQAMIDAASAGNLTDVIKVLPPDEMGVLHDYGALAIEQADGQDLTSEMNDLDVSFSDVKWTTSEVTGGTKVSIESITVTADGETATITRDPDAGSLTVTLPGQPAVTLDESTIDTYIAQASGDESLDPQMIEIIKREFKQLIGLGVVTVEVDGKWYVSPIRSTSDIFLSLLKGLEPGDIDYLIELAGN
ncbi:MAG: hypothetical protein ABWZ98_14405 [Nakamurella sp.]